MCPYRLLYLEFAPTVLDLKEQTWVFHLNDGGDVLEFFLQVVEPSLHAAVPIGDVCPDLVVSRGLAIKQQELQVFVLHILDEFQLGPLFLADVEDTEKPRYESEYFLGPGIARNLKLTVADL